MCFKVITGEQIERLKLELDGKRQEQIDTVEEEEQLQMYGKPLRDPILGKHFQLPGRSAVEQRISLDITASYTPVFTNLKIHGASNLERPVTPPAIRRLAKESYMDFYNSTQNEDIESKGINLTNDKPTKRKLSIRSSFAVDN